MECQYVVKDVWKPGQPTVTHRKWNNAVQPIQPIFHFQ